MPWSLLNNGLSATNFTVFLCFSTIIIEILFAVQTDLISFRWPKTPALKEPVPTETDCGYQPVVIHKSL